MESTSGGDRGLACLPQELIDQICGELLNGRDWEGGAGADVRAMHYTCKLLQWRTCKLILEHGIKFDPRGATMLWLMSRDKNIRPHVNRIELCCTYTPIDCMEANGSLISRPRAASTSAPRSNKTAQRRKKANSLKLLVDEIASLLSEAIGAFSNLAGMKLTLKPDEALFGKIPVSCYRPEDVPARYKRAFLSLWQVEVVLYSLLERNLIEFELVDTNITPKVEPINDRVLFPSALLSPLASVTTLKLDNQSESRYEPPDHAASGNRHVTSFLQAMPNLKTLQIQNEGCCWAAGMQDLLQQDYPFRLETFRLHHCQLLDFDGLVALLRKSSSTLRTLSIINVDEVGSTQDRGEANQATFSTFESLEEMIENELDLEDLELNRIYPY